MLLYKVCQYTYIFIKDSIQAHRGDAVPGRTGEPEQARETCRCTRLRSRAQRVTKSLAVTYFFAAMALAVSSFTLVKPFKTPARYALRSRVTV